MNKNIKILIGILALFIIVVLFFTVIEKNKMASTFKDFQVPLGEQNKTTLENNIKIGRYDDRAYYDLFNDLYFKFHVKDGAKIWECINNQETGECIFYNAILNNNEKLCNKLPDVRDVASPGKYGTSYSKYYYRLSCILDTRMLEKYNSELDKITFCKNFGEKYIQDQCLIYTCESYYWNTEKPKECTKENINSWFGIY